MRVRGNTATNDVTGNVIKTKPPTNLYANNHDKIFASKPATEWITFADHKEHSLDDFTGDVNESIKYKVFKQQMGLE
jgi:hypothetical protein